MTETFTVTKNVSLHAWIRKHAITTESYPPLLHRAKTEKITL